MQGSCGDTIPANNVDYELLPITVHMPDPYDRSAEGLFRSCKTFCYDNSTTDWTAAATSPFPAYCNPDSNSCGPTVLYFSWPSKNASSFTWDPTVKGRSIPWTTSFAVARVPTVGLAGRLWPLVALSLAINALGIWTRARGSLTINRKENNADQYTYV